jgi:hypothetical protein
MIVIRLAVLTKSRMCIHKNDVAESGIPHLIAAMLRRVTAIHAHAAQF